MPSNWHWLFFYSCFLGLALFIAIAPLNKFIIIIKLLIPHFLQFNVTIRNKFQRVSVPTSCIITDLLGFKVIRNVGQVPWVCLDCSNAHLLYVAVVRDKKIWGQSDTHIPVRMARCVLLLHLSWVFKPSGSNSNVYGSMRTASPHTYWVLRWSGISRIQFGTDVFINTLQCSANIDTWTKFSWWRQ